MKELLDRIKAEEDREWEALHLQESLWGIEHHRAQIRRVRWTEIRKIRRMVEKRMEELGEI